jgi:hypothetical protein
LAKDISINNTTYNNISTVTLPTSNGDTANYYDVTGTTAVSSDIVSGKTAVISSGPVTGTMIDNGSVTETISNKDDVVSINSGYYSGTSTVSISSEEKEKLVSENIKKGVTILGVTGNNATGTLKWEYIGRGVDWNQEGGIPDKLTVKQGQIIRTYQTYIDSDKKTAFYDYNYFLVTGAGVLPTPTTDNIPTNHTGNDFTLGTATVKCITDDNHRWLANKDYSVGDYCFTEPSRWFPCYCYRCVQAGHSNGYRPVHTTKNNGNGIVDGIDVYPANLDACWWEYVEPASTFISKKFSANMQVVKDEIILVGENLYKVLQSGQLKEVPPMDTAWLGSFVEGTAKLSFIGTTWTEKSWRALGSYCTSMDANGTLQIYQLVQHAGITSGSRPVPGNGRTIDGDIIWQETQETATKGAWAAKTEYSVGDIVTHAGNNYKCIFDGKLELPNRTTIENISTNMTTGGDVFAFWTGGTDVPTKLNPHGSWTIYINNLDLYRFKNFTNGYFCHAGNQRPKIVDMNLTQNIIQAGDSKIQGRGI